MSWEGTNLFFSHSDSEKKYYATDNINMLEFLIDNIFALFDGRVLQQTVGFQWAQTVLLLSLTCSFIRIRHTSYKENERKITDRSFDFTFRYIDDII